MVSDWLMWNGVHAAVVEEGRVANERGWVL